MEQNRKREGRVKQEKKGRRKKREEEEREEEGGGGAVAEEQEQEGDSRRLTWESINSDYRLQERAVVG